MNRTDRKNFLKAEFGKFHRIGFSSESIHFVDGNKDRLTATPQTRGGFAVKRDDAFLDVNDQNNDMGGFNCEFNLRQRARDNGIIRLFPA